MLKIDDPPDCKYKNICKWYERECVEMYCWRAFNLEGLINDETKKFINDRLFIKMIKEVKKNG